MKKIFLLLSIFSLLITFNFSFAQPINVPTPTMDTLGNQPTITTGSTTVTQTGTPTVDSTTNSTIVPFSGYQPTIQVQNNPTGYQPLVPEVTALGQQIANKSFGGDPINILLNSIVYIVIGVAVVLAIFMIIKAGYEYMSSSDSSDKKGRAKSRLQGAVGGLLLAIGAILILQTINPNITRFSIDLPDLRKPTGTLLPDGTYTLNPVTGEVYSTFQDKNVENYVLQKIKELGFSQLNPADKAAFFPNGGTDEEWLSLVSAMIKYESGFNPSTTYTENFKDKTGRNVVSTGLFQLSQESVSGYGFRATTEQLKDPYRNVDIGLHILKNWVQKDGYISGPKNTGGARYWSVLRTSGKLSDVKKTMQTGN